ncbi:MAG: DUF3011 domain-containing protein [Gemmatimonadales bacterium]|jgi:hypothetical protein|nr:DUF3011 domain-containing protein [Gemmatimonadales bacterium]
MHWSSVLVAAASVAVAMVVPEVVSAQQDVESFTCESNNNTHNECRYRASGVVTVHVRRQISGTRCVFDENWGTFDGGVWVDYGCRAEFVVRRPSQSTAQYRPVGGTMKSITCESRDGSRRECPIPNVDASTVTIERRLRSAECDPGRTWGALDWGSWVSGGCRAIFAYTTRGGGSHTPYAPTPHDYDVPCESLRGEWVHCDARDMQVARVERIAGNSECNAYKAWGTDDTGVWVRSNCQGVFRVRYRH